MTDQNVIITPDPHAAIPSSLPSATDYARLFDLYGRLEPYHYMQRWLLVMALQGSVYAEQVEKLFPTKEAFQHVTSSSVVTSAVFDAPECKIIQLDEDLIPLLEDTDPSYKDLHLPYPAMFINHQFKVGQFIINGFLLSEEKFAKAKVWETGYFRLESNFPDGIRVFAVILDTMGKFEFYSTEPLVENAIEHVGECYYDHPQERADMARASQLCITIAANLINVIINDEKDIDRIDIEASTEQNEKRIKRGKMPHRDKLFIRLGGKLKVYAAHYAQIRGEVKVRFLVRGHWKHFRAARYTNARGKQTWVYPYYRREDLPGEDINIIKVQKR